MAIYASDAIALFRDMQKTWKYCLNSHDFAHRCADCMGTVDWWAEQLGINSKLGPQLPWNVDYFVPHTSFPSAPPTDSIYPGDILVLGDPRSTNTRIKYAHIGIATTPGNYISNYDVGINIIEKTIDHIAAMQLVLIFHTGFLQEEIVIPNTPHWIGNLTVENTPLVRGVDMNTGILVDGLRDLLFSVLYDTDVKTPLDPNTPNSTFVHVVLFQNREVGILDRNCVYVPNVTVGDTSTLQAKINKAIADLS